jgi:hypothetical protein
MSCHSQDYTARVVTVRFTFSGTETRRMLHYVALHSRAPLLLLGCGVAFLAIGVAIGKTLLLVVGGGELVGWIVLVGVLPLLAPRGARQEHTISFSDDGVTAANARGSQRFPWSHWRRWRRTGHLYLLQGAGSVYTFVPQRAFASADAESEFQALLERHLPGARRGGRSVDGGRVVPGAVGQDEPR